VAYDFPFINGSKDQWDEYYYRKIVNIVPSMDNTPDLIYGDKMLMWLRLVNNGTIPLEVLRGEYFVHVKDYGAVGDGTTNDTTAILAAATVAVAKKVPLIFDGLKSYRVENCVLPANLMLQTNGCLFKKITNNNTYAIRISDGTVFDYIRQEVTGGASNEAGTYINGSNILGDSVEIYSLGGDQPGANAVLIGDFSNTKSNIIIRRIKITGFSSPMRTIKVTNSRFSNGDISNFMCGIYVVDNEDVTYDKWRIKGTSQSSVAPYNGQNGILIESQGADYSCSNIRFTDILVDGAPEHSYRIGGGLSARDISYTNCVSRHPGNAPGNLSTGGGAFKALGVVGHWHSNISYINCVAEDSNMNGAGLNNYTQFSFGFCEDVSLISPKVRKRDNTTYAAQLALFLNSVRRIHVYDPNFQDLRVRGVHIGKDGTDNSLTGVDGVFIYGGYIHSPSPISNGPLYFDTQQTITKNIYIQGTVLAAGNYAWKSETETTVGSDTGDYINCNVDITYQDANTGLGAPPVQTSNKFLHTYCGAVYSTAMAGKNGSKYTDLTTGNFAIRKAGAWTVL
jgi:hypothetical protein